MTLPLWKIYERCWAKAQPHYHHQVPVLPPVSWLSLAESAVPQYRGQFLPRLVELVCVVGIGLGRAEPLCSAGIHHSRNHVPLLRIIVFCCKALGPSAHINCSLASDN